MNKKLIDWSEKYYSHLPWRVNRSPYNTLVSEIMLQQTTVGTVLNHFDKFIEKYPNIETLSKISEDQIVKDWLGLGYYRRARNLLNAAKIIHKRFNNVIPNTVKKLKEIKGIGDYTSNAIMAMGLNERALAVDANIERVISRFYGIESEKGLKLQKEIYHLFQQNKICQDMNEYGGRAYNEALMDLGRSICKARSASCSLCPLQLDCVANKSNPLLFPKEPTLKSTESSSFELDLLRVIIKKENKVLAYRKSNSEWLSGQYELPTFILYSEDQKLSQYDSIQYPEYAYLLSFKTGITKYKIQNFVLYADIGDLDLPKRDYKYVDIEKVNLSTTSVKALNF